MKKVLGFLLITISVFSISSCKKSSQGQLTVYATCLQPYVEAACKKFESQTGISTSVRFISSAEILEMAKNGTNDADIWFGGNIDPYNEAAELGLLYPYKAKNASHLISSKYRDKDYYWYGVYSGVLGFFWNNHELESRGLFPPLDWDDLIKPEYKDLIVLGNPASSTTGRLIVNTVVQLKGKDAAMKYFNQLDKNVAEYTSAGVFPAEYVSDDKAVIGIGFLHDILRMMVNKTNDKIGMTTPISGTSCEIGATAIFKSTRNLKNAKKFIEFALSPDCVNLASKYGGYQMLLLDNAAPVTEAISAGLDRIETMDFDYNDAKKNGPSYCEEFLRNINADNRLKVYEY